MASITAVAAALGGIGQEMQGDTPLSVARELGLSTTGMSIFVNDEPATQGQTLHDNDIVSFQPAKVSSGKESVTIIV
tara:strand:- start:77 stop:307 length:231 start_codon:yes stop_codon:yes gene_type:complete